MAQQAQQSIPATKQRVFRDQLIRDHLPMAKRLARKMARRVPKSVRRDELESAAMLGLTEAANRFDAKRGEPFVAYAAKRVRGAVLDELRRNDVLTRRGREGARRLSEAARAVEAETGTAATPAEIASQLGVSLAQVEETRARVATVIVSLDESRDVPSSSPFATPEAQLERSEERSAVVAALASLGERELQILNMYFHDGLTLKEIGNIFQVSESRVSQLRSRALRSLRRQVEAIL